jgi:hypothetical protein
MYNLLKNGMPKLEKVGYTILLLTIGFAIVFSLTFLVFFIFRIFGWPIRTDLVNDILVTGVEAISKYPIKRVVLFTLVLSPVIEELSFRYHLKNFQSTFFLTITVVFCATIYFYYKSEILFYLLCSYGIILITTYYLIRYKFGKKKNLLKILIVISNCAFITSHLENIKAFNFEYAPILTSYFIYLLVISVSLTLIRFKYGFFYAVFLHFLLNLVPFVVSVFTF